VTEHKYILKKQRGLNTSNKLHTTVTCVTVTTFYIYVFENENVSITQPQYKCRIYSGCVDVNQIFHNTIRYTQPAAGYITAGLYREVVMTGDS
jgi:hypothetical protein